MKFKFYIMNVLMLTGMGIIIPVCAMEDSASNAIPSQKFDERLFKAIEACDLEQVEEMIGKGADINARNTQGQTPLIVAIHAQYFSEDIVKFLLTEMAPSIINDEQKKSEIIESINKLPSTMKDIQEEIKRFSVKNSSGVDVQLLIPQSNVSGTHSTAQSKESRKRKRVDDNNETEVVETGAITTYQDTSMEDSARNAVPFPLNEHLFKAIEKCDLEQVEEMIGKGADINARNTKEQNPVIAAIHAQYFSEDLVTYLLTKMAPSIINDEQKKSEIEDAINNLPPEIQDIRESIKKFFLEVCADIDFQLLLVQSNLSEIINDVEQPIKESRKRKRTDDDQGVEVIEEGTIITGQGPEINENRPVVNEQVLDEAISLLLSDVDVIHKCRECPIALRTLKELFEHAEKVHKKKCCCPYCNKRKRTFETLKGLCDHCERSHEIYECSVCSASIFLNKDDFIAHKKDHNTIKCEKCNERFCSQTERTAHYRRNHLAEEKEDIVICDTYGKGYTQRRLRDHKKNCNA